jgi:hypothetical protein
MILKIAVYCLGRSRSVGEADVHGRPAHRVPFADVDVCPARGLLVRVGEGSRPVDVEVAELLRPLQLQLQRGEPSKGSYTKERARDHLCHQCRVQNLRIGLPIPESIDLKRLKSVRIRS